MLRPVLLRLRKIVGGLGLFEMVPDFSIKGIKVIRIYKISSLDRKERCCTVEWIGKEDNIDKYRINVDRYRINSTCTESNINILICEILKIMMNKC